MKEKGGLPQEARPGLRSVDNPVQWLLLPFAFDAPPEFVLPLWFIEPPPPAIERAIVRCS